MYIPYGRQLIEEDDIKAVIDALQSDYLTTGPKIEEFEQAVANYTGAKYAVAVANGTAALHIACLAAGITEGDEVITSPITFAASSNCVLYCGGKPVFADIEMDSYNINPLEIEKLITDKTKAIIPVHFTGQPCDMEEITRIARKHNLIVIEDAAHALGATYGEKKIGCISDMTILSFHPVKHITTGEGGMILTNSKELYQRMKLFCTHGITRDENLLLKNDGPWYYEQQELGFNYRITDIQCALGISQMKKLPKFLERRKEIAKRYDMELGDVKDLQLPPQKSLRENAWHLYVILVPAERRRELFNSLRQVGIGVNVHYVPVYQHPYYQKNGYDTVHCPNAEEYYSRAISIPMYAGLTDEMQTIVIEEIKKLME
jgi:UDP-4-amino-4,6-dideoxy-N-acetyl-beta-L-altrosamine transaminase